MLTSNGLNTMPERSIDERSDIECSRDAGIIARSATLASDQEGLARTHAANGSSVEAWSSVQTRSIILRRQSNPNFAQRLRCGTHCLRPCNAPAMSHPLRSPDNTNPVMLR